MKPTPQHTEENPEQPDGIDHVKMPYGTCSVCGHVGDDCTGIDPSTIDAINDTPPELRQGLQLSAKDWMEIYYAVEDKISSAAVAGDDRTAKKWRTHLHRILKLIGPSGIAAHLRGVVPTEPWCVHLSVSGGVAIEHAAPGIDVTILDYDDSVPHAATTLYCDSHQHTHPCDGTLYVPPSIGAKGLPHIIAHARRCGWHDKPMSADLNGSYEYVCHHCHARELAEPKA